MSHDEQEFVQIPTMTIHKPKKKPQGNKALILGLVILGAAVVIVAIAVFLLL